MPGPPPLVVHFLTDRERALPLCEEWRGEPSWTSVREVVTCPFCLSRLASAYPTEASRRHFGTARAT